MISDESKMLARYRYEKALSILIDAKDAFAMGRYENAVGRAYYSVFTAMRALLALKEVDSKSHSGVFTLFNQHYIRSNLVPRGFAKLIRAAKVIREKADYGDFQHVSKQTAGEHIKNAEVFLEKVDALIRELLLNSQGEEA